ncbi:MAG: helix-turn-helix domain-containing protein [Chthoniobacteraceae bacterium]
MEQLNKNAIGAQVRRIRTLAGISQQQLSVLCLRKGYEISRSTLAKIEAGIRAVSDVELFALAKGLDIKLEDLFPAGFEKALKANKISPYRIRRKGGDNAA